MRGSRAMEEARRQGQGYLRGGGGDAGDHGGRDKKQSRGLGEVGGEGRWINRAVGWGRFGGG